MSKVKIFLTVIIAIAFLCGCLPAAQKSSDVNITIAVDGKEIKQTVPQGTSIQTALDIAGVKLGQLDKIDPPSFSLIAEDTTIHITRVKEDFEVVENTVPFEVQTVLNESLPVKMNILIQPGSNGSEKVTYRIVSEDGVEKSKTIFKTETLVEAIPQITMIGVQAPFAATPITGRIAYLTAGNAWVMEETTGNRKPVAMSGDLDGHVFSLSPDGNWLLYTRKATADQKDSINTLWVVNVAQDKPVPVSLHVKNVILYAGWVAGKSNQVAYSTVEPRSTAPGWQANNDLHYLMLTSDGYPGTDEVIIESNSGGVYGWWGTEFSFSSDGQLAYARPDSVGLVNIKDKKLEPLFDVIPYNSQQDWAWVPPLAWADNGKILYTVSHLEKTGLSNQETSPLFDLTALDISSNLSITLEPQVGMFAYPVLSPIQSDGHFWVGYLKATSSERSDTSHYTLNLMDRDGSNKHQVFPSEGAAGLTPQHIAWAPTADKDGLQWFAYLYNGNLYLMNTKDLQPVQVTGDGSFSRLDWQK